MSKQDRQGVRTPSDLERKYDFEQIEKQTKITEKQKEQINQLNQSMSQFSEEATKSITALQEQIDETTEEFGRVQKQINEASTVLSDLQKQIAKANAELSKLQTQVDEDTNAKLNTHVESENNPHNVTASQIGALTKSNAFTELGIKATATELNYTDGVTDNIQTQLNKKADLDENGLIVTSQLPSYVDDVLEYASKSSFPATGTAGKIYVDTSTNKTYRWGGSAYVEISPSIALGETSSTAYRGDRGKIAYEHSQSAHDYSPSNHSHNAVTTSANGFMSASDKKKLDGIATGANAYSHPTSSGNKHIPSGGSSGQILRWGAEGTAVWGADNNTTYSTATQSANGLLSASDKKKLDGIPSDTQTQLNNKANVDLLWTNPDTTSVVFRGQTLTIPNMENYSLILLVYWWDCGRTTLVTQLIVNYIKNTSLFTTAGVGTPARTLIRDLECSGNSLTFSNLWDDGVQKDESNCFLIPHQVCGIL